MACPDPETLIELAQGTLDAETMAGLDEHLDTCADCRRVIASLATSWPPAEADSGEVEPVDLGSVGRYRLDRELGRGGMGVVYEAFDPQLRRKIAVKVLRPGLHKNAESRMLREARLLARFKHPNVVTIYDVGVSDSGEVFLAMELAARGSLRTYMSARGRTREEICAAFVQAGRGLSAAHERGLVHRDFKPDNVLVTDDGELRVTDFGLAMSLEPEEETATGAEGPRSGPGSSRRSAALTRTGTVLGTPAYMAPEQHAGQDADPRSDQFAFAVSVFEALAGHRPYRGESAEEIARAALRKEIDWSTRRFSLSSTLRDALGRALSPRREDRYPTLAPLLAALQRETAPSLRVPIALVAGAAVVVTAAVTLARIDKPPAARPTAVAAPAPSDAASNGGCGAATLAREVLGGAARERAAATLGAIRPDAAERVLRPVDAWISAFDGTYAARCEAAIASKEDGAARRISACFERQLGRAAALVEMLGQLDPARYEYAGHALATLPSMVDCDDPDIVGDETEIALASDDPSRALVRAVDRAASWTAIGRGDAARAELEPALASAAAVPAALRAEGGLALALAQISLGDRDAAMKTLDDVLVLLADAPRAKTLALARLARASLLAFRDRSAARAELAAVVASAKGRPATADIVSLAHARAAMLHCEDEALESAVTEVEAALASLVEPPVAVRSEVLTTAVDIGIAAGREDLAQRVDELVAAWDGALGASHPMALRAHARRAEVLISMGKMTEGIPLLETTRFEQERTLPPLHPDLVPTYRFLALALAAHGRLDEAVTLAESRLPILRATPPMRRLEKLHDALHVTAELALALGDNARAAQYARESLGECYIIGAAARDACERDARGTLGAALAYEDPRSALAELTRSLEIVAKPPPFPKTKNRSDMLRVVALSMVGRKREAIERAEELYVEWPDGHPGLPTLREMLMEWVGKVPARP